MRMPRFGTSTEPVDLDARREQLAAKRAQGIIQRWDEIPRSRLDFSGRHWIEDTETGNFYLEFAGDPGYAAPVVAYYVRADGTPIMLEPANPESRAELERRQAAKEQHRADRETAAKQRRAALRAATK